MAAKKRRSAKKQAKRRSVAPSTNGKDQGREPPPKKILNLDSLAERQEVSIGGRVYEILNPDDLSPLSYRVAVRDLRKVLALEDVEDSSEITPEREEELSLYLDKLCRRLLDAPAEVQDSLNDAQREEISAVFVRLFQGSRRLGRAMNMAEAALDTAATEDRKKGRRKSTGGKSLPA